MIPPDEIRTLFYVSYKDDKDDDDKSDDGKMPLYVGFHYLERTCTYFFPIFSQERVSFMDFENATVFSRFFRVHFSLSKKSSLLSLKTRLFLVTGFNRRDF